MADAKLRPLTEGPFDRRSAREVAYISGASASVTRPV